jgi:hypothetical protein
MQVGIGTLIATAPLAFVGTLTPSMLVAWFAAFGLLAAHGKALFPPHQVGRGLTGLTMGSMGGTLLARPLADL